MSEKNKIKKHLQELKNKILQKSDNKGKIIAIIIILMWYTLTNLIFPKQQITTWQNSTVITDNTGNPLCATLSSNDEWSLSIPLEEMGEWMPKIIIELEDRKFYYHNGIDFAAIIRATIQNTKAKKTISGGSTITAQTIRLGIERERTPLNKIKEFNQAIILEYLLTKHDILETYLNRVPMGGNIRGIEAASLAWFDKSAKDISLAEATLLAGILRGPSYYRPDKHPERALKLRNRLLDTLAERKIITNEQAERAKREKIPTERNSIPSKRRQTAEQIIKQRGKTTNRDKYGKIKSTIEITKQNLLEKELKNALKTLPTNITGAAVLIENENGAVRAYVGNAKEGEPNDTSWVDCAASKRSPGSVLKPFTFALAFEKGTLTPSTIMADTPYSMKGSAPRNYDRYYRGPVSARTALADSLNIPAVRVLRLVKPTNTLSLYRRLGFSSFTKDSEWYGDSLILGGCEVSPLETATAYRTLANGGIKSSTLWIEGEKKEKGEQIITNSSCYLTLDILKDTGRILPIYREIFGEKGTKIAFKTGTSYGLRDAWTAAVTKKYTLVVWLGDPTGKPTNTLIGLKTATPPAIKIMRALTPDGTKWFDKPHDVKERQVCPLSGAPRNQHCPQAITELYIKDTSATEPCTMHKIQNGKITVQWPQELENYYETKTAKEVNKVTILSPQKNATYKKTANSTKLPLIAEGKGTLYWFVNGELKADNDRENAFWEMKKGTHTIYVTDEQGNSDTAKIKITDGQKEPKKQEQLPTLEEIN
ncbi:MAG: penicillin-binding protein 1C [Synergistaceae bacterium]